MIISISNTKKLIDNLREAFSFTAAQADSSLSLLQGFSKEKILNTDNIDALLAFLKSVDKSTLAEYAGSAEAKANRTIILALLKAKTTKPVLEGIKKIRKPSAKILNNSDKNQNIGTTVVKPRVQTQSTPSPTADLKHVDISKEVIVRGKPTSEKLHENGLVYIRFVTKLKGKKEIRDYVNRKPAGVNDGIILNREYRAAEFPGLTTGDYGVYSLDDTVTGSISTALNSSTDQVMLTEKGRKALEGYENVWIKGDIRSYYTLPPKRYVGEFD